MKLLELLADGKHHSGQELYRLGVLGQVVEAQAQGYVIHRWLERRDPSQRVWWYRLAASRTEPAEPSASEEESGGALATAGSVGRVPLATAPLEQMAPSSAPACSPRPSLTTSAVRMDESETRPQTLFDVPARPQWA